MSGIAAICNLDGKPADFAALKRMTDRIAHRGPDAVGHWVDGAVAIGHRLLRTTIESAGEHQPLSDETLRLCLSFDGRVDNRHELRRALDAQGAPARDDTDAEIVLRSYQCWGDECANRILGDFAFIMWDGRRRQVTCARDPLGIRPFYYYADARTFVCGSEIRQIFASRIVSPRPNTGMIGEYLSDQPNHLEETLYDGVMRLPPGRVLTLQDGRLRVRRHFVLDPRKDVRYRTDQQYAEHFRDLFRTCVESRLRSASAASVFLSGGVDSSSILGMAQSLAGRQGPSVNVLSLASSHPEADESVYVQDVCRMWGIRIQVVSADSYVSRSLTDQVEQLQDFPDAPNLSPWGPLVDRARAAGSSVVLMGHGGDEWLTGDSLHCGDLLREWRPAAALRQVRHDLRVSRIWGGNGGSLRDAARWLIVPVLPSFIKAIVRPLRGRGFPPWIRPEFANRIDLAQRLRGDAERVLPFPTAAQRIISSFIESGRGVLEREVLDRFGASFSIEFRYPFHDRRLVEFSLAIPENQRWRDDQTKFVLRQAMHDLLPASVRRRMTKAEFSYMFTAALEREGTGTLFRTLRLVREGYVDQRSVQRMYERSKVGPGPDLSAVWMILATERWYRAMFDPPAANLREPQGT
jgi:asparagine synthase (glutamine-hydrolysing)